jgi:hypothetical protein
MGGECCRPSRSIRRTGRQAREDDQPSIDKAFRRLSLESAASGPITRLALLITRRLGLPNPRRTPGAINAAATEAGLEATVCKPGWAQLSFPWGTTRGNLPTGCNGHRGASGRDQRSSVQPSIALVRRQIDSYRISLFV